MADGPNVFDTLLMPLRLPGRVVSDVESAARAVVSLQSEAKQHLGSIDKSARELVDGMRELTGSIKRIEKRVNKLEQERMDAFLEAIASVQASIDRIEGRVEELETIEQTLTTHLDGLRADLNERMLSVEHEVRTLGPPLAQMTDDVAKIDDLLPNPGDGPLTRLKDTLTSSS